MNSGTPTPRMLRAAPPSPEQRNEDLEARIAEIDRGLRIRVGALLAATIFSLLAGIAAVVIVVSATNENANKDQVRTLRNHIGSVRQKAVAAQDGVNSISSRLDSIKRRLDPIERRLDPIERRLSTLSGQQRTNQDELSVIQGDIKDLRERIANLKDAVARDSAAHRASAVSP
jgi:chromosome segregation ATPase